MLLTISLAERLFPKYGLLSYSVHLGVIEGTGLGANCDWATSFGTLRKLHSLNRLIAGL